jgi:hypothetical protein
LFWIEFFILIKLWNRDIGVKALQQKCGEAP